jgi:hypothetical protein
LHAPSTTGFIAKLRRPTAERLVEQWIPTPIACFQKLSGLQIILKSALMSTEEVAKCGDRLQYLYEVLYSIRRNEGKRFPDIKAELSMLLRLLIVSREYVPFQEAMRLCDECSGAIDSKVRECAGQSLSAEDR